MLGLPKTAMSNISGGLLLNADHSGQRRWLGWRRTLGVEDRRWLLLPSHHNSATDPWYPLDWHREGIHLKRRPFRKGVTSGFSKISQTQSHRVCLSLWARRERVLLRYARGVQAAVVQSAIQRVHKCPQLAKSTRAWFGFFLIGSVNCYRSCLRNRKKKQRFVHRVAAADHPANHMRL